MLISETGVKYLVDPTESDQGATGNGKTIKAFVDAIGSNKATLILRHKEGDAQTTYQLSTSETIPSNITFEIENGAILNIASGKTLTIENFKDPGPIQVFSGDGSVSFGDGAVTEVYPEWWKSNTTPGTTDMTNAIQAAFTAGSAAHTKVVLQGETYRCDSGLSSSSVDILGTHGSKIDLRGSSGISFTGGNCTWKNFSIDSSNGTMTDVLYQGDGNITSWIIENIKFRGKSDRSQKGIKLDRPSNHMAFYNSIRNCELTHFDVGIYLGETDVSRQANANIIEETYFEDCTEMVSLAGTNVLRDNYITVDTAVCTSAINLRAGTLQIYGGYWDWSGGGSPNFITAADNTTLRIYSASIHLIERRMTLGSGVKLTMFTQGSYGTLVEDLPGMKPNLIGNGNFESWSIGGSFVGVTNAVNVADGWIARRDTAGSSIDISQDATVYDTPPYSLKMEANTNLNGAKGWLSVGSSSTFRNLPFNYEQYKGYKLIFSVRIKSNKGVYLTIYDGVSTSSSPNHPGDGSWKTLTVGRIIDNSADRIDLSIRLPLDDADAYMNVDSAYLTATINTETPSSEPSMKYRQNIYVPALDQLNSGYIKIGQKKHYYGTAAPTTGTWEVGDIVWNTSPSAGGTPGWVCVTAGEPGTWKAMANLAS